MMKRTQLLFLALCILPYILHSQVTHEPALHHAKPTPKGVGKIDARIDNMS